ncbi:PREDICTED: uncharacterized protein LOC108556918 isoform X2 [Nicrophorus vespilloides]|uniref:Uncharacterized protein LOC108556918 isoform X2 n=1 Tax=Nicrophorus vespilloides TaxID=110193 RepID=A0ABM1M2C2_NICVS|nr:PREDICTED: uncharacterized protein LOC108556918 isoform X2 [Nicrophorus vespilloides]
MFLLERSNNPIDFPFMDRSKIEDGIHYLSKDESDSPEFIDINALMIPSEYQSCLTIDKPTSAASSTQPPFPVPPFLKRNRKPNTKNYGNHEDNDDDVIFVREYKKFEKKDESKVYPAPRRNPKRQVQLQKISYELAEKMSMDDYFENNVYCKKEYYMANARRSSRATGAVFSPPDPLSTNDFKKWPVDGMHEKPRYNAVAKKLEKIHQVTKQPKMKIPKTTHNRRKVPNRRRKPKLITVENDKELENVSHQMLHYVLSYVQQIKECNEILKTNEADAKRNLKHAEELMKNTSLLYCLTTDTTESNLAEYLRTIGEKENAHDFLINIISDFET